MNAFVLSAVLLTVLTLALLLWPLLKGAGAQPKALQSAVVVVALALAGGVGLYYTWSNWNWNAPTAQADSPQAMVGRLARRLEKNPEDLDGWLRLGRSYAVLEQYPLSARAYQQAEKLSGGKSVEALTGLAEALILSERGDLAGRPGRLFEEALALDPNSTKALFYSAIAALERGDRVLAKQRFTTLLSGNPPPEVRQLIQAQITALDAPDLSPAGTGSAAMAAGPTADRSVSAAAATAEVVNVPLRISLASSVAGRAAPGAPLFVLARIPGQRGPPLAALRLEAKFPQELTLKNTDAMMGGSGFSAGQELEIEARVANGGSAISQSGDPFGTLKVRAGASQRAVIEINQLKP